MRANGHANCTLRLVVVRNDGGMWVGSSPSPSGSDVLALTADSKDWGDSVRLTVQPNARFARRGVCRGQKDSFTWAANLVWAERAQQKGFRRGHSPE